MHHSKDCKNKNCPFFGKDPTIQQCLEKWDAIPNDCPWKEKIAAPIDLVNKIFKQQIFEWSLPSRAMIEQLNRSQKIAEMVQVYLEPIKWMFEKNNALFQNLNQQFWVPNFITALPNYSKILGDYFERFQISFNIAEWEWLEELLENENRGDIMQLLYKGKIEEFKKEIFSFCTEKQNLNNIAEKLKQEPLCATRIVIIEDAFWAHLQNKYTLSIPALLPQIEGIIWDLGTELKFVDGQNIKSRQKGTVQECGSIGHVVTELKDQELDPIIKEHIVEDIIPQLRIPILHGRDIEYPTKENSTKVILFLYALYYSIKKNRQQKNTWVIPKPAA